MGLDPSPAVGDALATVEAWWIGGDFQADRDAALVKLREVVATLADGVGKG